MPPAGGRVAGVGDQLAHEASGVGSSGVAQTREAVAVEAGQGPQPRQLERRARPSVAGRDGDSDQASVRIDLDVADVGSPNPDPRLLLVERGQDRAPRVVGQLGNAVRAAEVELDQVDRVVGHRDQRVAEPLSKPAIAQLADELPLPLAELVEQQPLSACSRAQDKQRRGLLDGDRREVTVRGHPRLAADEQREVRLAEGDPRRGCLAGWQEPPAAGQHDLRIRHQAMAVARRGGVIGEMVAAPRCPTPRLSRTGRGAAGTGAGSSESLGHQAPAPGPDPSGRRAMRRLVAAMAAAAFTLLVAAAPMLACGGLIGPNGAVNLVRTTTFAGYHDGVEHYVTAFKFAGGGGKFGSIIPLPGIPTSVERGGDWTLQRLIRETTPQPEFLAAPACDKCGKSLSQRVEVILTTKIDALDITVLKGGGAAVGAWATEHGFRLPPDAPEVLDFYSARSPIFLAASFDADAAAARGQAIGDGTPVHITIPTDNPWVPLRILGLGKVAGDRVSADVFLMTDFRPSLAPNPVLSGLNVAYNQQASDSLLTDLRSDKGMGWVPKSAWLTKIGIDIDPSRLTYDLAIDASGGGHPSLVAAGLIAPAVQRPGSDGDGSPWGGSACSRRLPSSASGSA